jgi:hypothetical protein
VEIDFGGRVAAPEGAATGVGAAAGLGCAAAARATSE